MHFVQVQDGSPGQKAGLEAFFDFIVAIGNTRLVSCTLITHWLCQHKLPCFTTYDVLQSILWRVKYVNIAVHSQVVCSFICMVCDILLFIWTEKNSVSISQGTIFLYYKDQSLNVVYSEKHIKHTNALCGGSELLNVKGKEDIVTTLLCFR